MSHRFRVLARCLVVCSLFCYTLAAHAETGDLIVVDGFYGRAATSNEQYDDSPVYDASMGYMSRGWIYRAGVTGGERFTLSSSRRGEVEVYGAYVQAVKIFEFPWLDIELGAGLYRNTIKAYLLLNDDQQTRLQTGTTNQVNSFYSVAMVKDLTSLLSLELVYRNQLDVGGTNISLLMGGARIRF